MTVTSWSACKMLNIKLINSNKTIKTIKIINSNKKVNRLTVFSCALTTSLF